MRLQDLSDSTVDREELLYNASVLAHYAQVSTQPDVDVPAPSNLSAVFDHFVADSTLLNDRLMMETAGAQCLLLAGFFEDQMRRRAGRRRAVAARGGPRLHLRSRRAECQGQSMRASRSGWSRSRGDGAHGIRESARTG